MRRESIPNNHRRGRITAKFVYLIMVSAFVAIGLLFAVTGAAIGWASWHTHSGALRAIGTVMEVVRVPFAGTVRSANWKPAFAPVVEYHVAGETYRVCGQISSSSPAYAVGEIVGVLYSPDKPAEGRIDSFAERWLAPIIFGGGGLLFAMVGVGMLWSRHFRSYGDR